MNIEDLRNYRKMNTLINDINNKKTTNKIKFKNHILELEPVMWNLSKIYIEYDKNRNETGNYINLSQKDDKVTRFCVDNDYCDIY